MLRVQKELKDKVRKELIELLEYHPAPLGSLQKISPAHSIPITTVYSWNSDLKRTRSPSGPKKVITALWLRNSMRC